MSPLPTIPNVFLCRFVWTSVDAPRPATTGIHFLDTVGTQTEADLNTDLNASVSANMWNFPVSSAAVTSLVITDLSTDTAGVIFPQAAAAKWSGSGGSDPILQGAAVVSLKTPLRGKAGRGRIFLPWVAEIQQTKGALVPANVTTAQTAWSAFLTAMIAAGWTPVVAHYATSSWTPVTSVIVRPNLKTQRRRTLR